MTARAPQTDPRKKWRVMAAIAAMLAAFLAPWWSPPLLARLTFFRVRRVEVNGTHYIQADDIYRRLRIDSTMSVWDDPRPLEARVANYPGVRSATIERKLPGTLVVRISENVPVAFVPSAGGLRATDADGRLLPLDPSRVDVDLPVLERVDTALVRLLADVQGANPSLFGRINAARRGTGDELTFSLPGVTVRARANVTAARLTDIIPVEQDLARRGARPTELDLRFRDQVIARLQ
jgi:cell division protein FtsQ